MERDPEQASERQVGRVPLFEALGRALASREHTRLNVPEVLLKPSAVLVPLYWQEGVGPGVVLTERRKTLRAHAGQISFPGGSCDPTDRSPLHTALRESHEELGIQPQHVDVLGPLDEYPTLTRYKISPFVGVIPHPYRFLPSLGEVEKVLAVPLAALCAEGVFQQERVPLPVPGLERYKMLYAYQVGPDRIWGATAAILTQLLEFVRRLPGTGL